MAVSRTAHLNCVDSSGSTTNTQAFNCSGGTTLFVFAESATNTAGDITGATYNGVSMVEMGRIAPPAQNREIVAYGLQAPASGSNNIVVTRTTGTSRFVISAFAYTGTSVNAAIRNTSFTWYAKTNSNTASSIAASLTNWAGFAVCGFVKCTSGSQSSGANTTIISSSDVDSDFEATTIPASANFTSNINCSSGDNCIVAVGMPPVGLARDSYSNATGGTSSGDLTWTHNVQGSNTLLIVHGYAESSKTLTAKYNGVSMTEVTHEGPTSGETVYTWYLINPTTGSNSVAITPSASCYRFGMAVSYTGAKQSGQPDAFNSSSSASATSRSVSVTTVANNSWITGFFAQGSTTAGHMSGTGSFSILYQGTGNSSSAGGWQGTGMLDTNALITPAGATTVGASTSDGADFANLVATSIAPIATVVANGNFLAFM